MTIYIINQFALKPSVPGGTRHFSLAKEFVRAGHKVYIIASNVHYATREQFAVSGTRENIEGVEYVWLETKPYRGNLQRFLNHIHFSLKCAWLLCSGKLPKADVVIGSSPHPFSAIVGKVYSGLKKIPFIFEIRDLWPETLVDLGAVKPSHPLARLLYAIEKYLVNNSQSVVHLMPNATSYFSSRHLRPRRTLWLPNGIDFELLNINNVDAKPPEKFVAMYLGSHGVANGLEILLPAAKLLENNPNIKFVCVGDGPCRGNLISKASSMGLRNIEFLPPVPKAEIGRLLANCDLAMVFALPSPLYRWGISFNKIYDYFAAKKPIVFVGKVASNPVAEANAGVVIEEFDSTQLAEAVLRLSQKSREDLNQLSENGFVYGNQNHNIKSLAAKYLNEIAEVVR